ncbi:MAG: phosphate ABC transporter substrate-binding protein [Candidatus Firestonebacteria bacterium]|nr:phosphate ABC transporter substrate-binding protein [Candidatus Firestonebacteria bacterium]
MLNKKQVYIYLLSLLFLLIIINGCGKKTESISIAGSTAFQPFAEKLAEEYMHKNLGVSINVQGGGSSMGIRSAISGIANIGMADLVDLPPEARSLKQYVVALDGIVIIVNPNNKIENLSTDEIQKIFSGEISKWQELGGEDKPINIISREEGSGTRSSFEALAMGDKHLSERSIIQDSNGTVRENVAGDPNAIGYISYGLINDKIKVVKFNDIIPTHENLKNRTYKLIRPIFLLTKGEPEGLAKKYLDFVLSTEGQKILEKQGLIPAK